MNLEDMQMGDTDMQRDAYNAQRCTKMRFSEDQHLYFFNKKNCLQAILKIKVHLNKKDDFLIFIKLEHFDVMSPFYWDLKIDS